MVDAIFRCEECGQDVIANDYKDQEAINIAAKTGSTVICLLCGEPTKIAGFQLEIRPGLNIPKAEKLSINETSGWKSSRIAPNVLEAIDAELAHQEARHGKGPARGKAQSLAGFLVILESEIGQARNGWLRNSPGRNSPLAEIVQVVATGIACLNKYGVEGSAEPTYDIPAKCFEGKK